MLQIQLFEPFVDAQSIRLDTRLDDMDRCTVGRPWGVCGEPGREHHISFSEDASQRISRRHFTLEVRDRTTGDESLWVRDGGKDKHGTWKPSNLGTWLNDNQPVPATDWLQVRVSDKISVVGRSDGNYQSLKGYCLKFSTTDTAEITGPELPLEAMIAWDTAMGLTDGVLLLTPTASRNGTIILLVDENAEETLGYSRGDLQAYKGQAFFESVFNPTAIPSIGAAISYAMRQSNLTYGGNHHTMSGAEVRLKFQKAWEGGRGFILAYVEPVEKDEPVTEIQAASGWQASAITELGELSERSPLAFVLVMLVGLALLAGVAIVLLG